MKISAAQLVFTTLVLIIPAAAGLKRGDTTTLRQINIEAAKHFDEICSVGRDGNDAFEATIAFHVREFSSRLSFELTGWRPTPLASVEDIISSKNAVDLTSPTAAETPPDETQTPVMNDAESEELRKRQWRQGEQTLSRVPIALTKALNRPCNEFRQAVTNFNKGLERLIYSAGERCGGQCAKDGLVFNAIQELQDIYLGRGSMSSPSGLVAHVRDWERQLRCQRIFMIHELNGNDYNFNRVKTALKDGETPFGSWAHPCQDRKRN